jgi:hypothetical protein
MYGVINEFVPEPIVQPPAAIPPTPGTYTTIADLGKELDRIENKLHWVLDFTNGQTIQQTAPMEAVDVIEVPEADEDIELDADVAAFIVTTTNIGPQADIRFGNPQQLFGVGRVVIGNGTAWGPPTEITVSPMLFLKTSPLQKQVRVQVDPPAVATVTTLKRLPPQG